MCRKYSREGKKVSQYSGDHWCVNCLIEPLFYFFTAIKHKIKALLRLRSHENDIVPLSYRSDFWNGKVDCSHGSGPLSYQFWDLFTRVRYRIVPKHFAPKQAKENLICQQIRVISIWNLTNNGNMRKNDGEFWVQIYRIVVCLQEPTNTDR